MNQNLFVRHFRAYVLALTALAVLSGSWGCFQTQIKTRDKASETAVMVACKSLMVNIQMAALDKGRAPTLEELQTGIAMLELRAFIVGADDALPQSGYQGYCFIYLTSDDDAKPSYAVIARPLAGVPGAADRPLMYVSSGLGQVFKAPATATTPSVPYLNDQMPADWQ
ncbi:MAG: hypothetical protein ABIH86_06805 [Planctomycetota bacterium]